MPKNREKLEITAITLQLQQQNIDKRNNHQLPNIYLPKTPIVQ